MNIAIGLNKNINEVKKVIDIHFPNKNIKIKKCSNSRYILFINNIKRNILIGSNPCDIVTDMILDTILNIYLVDIIQNGINNIPKKLKTWEKKKILQIIKEILLNNNKFINEKQYIRDEIKNYIDKDSVIWVDGFIQFRLKKLDDFVDLLINKGITEFNAEKEYKEFIEVLQYFVNIQEPKYNLVDLILQNENYELYDEMNNVIDKDFFKEIIEEIGGESISKDDLLISSLIVIAPKKLRIHLDERDKDRDVIRIISNVFQDRVHFCYRYNKNNERIRIKSDKPY